MLPNSELWLAQSHQVMWEGHQTVVVEWILFVYTFTLLQSSKTPLDLARSEKHQDILCWRELVST